MTNEHELKFDNALVKVFMQIGFTEEKAKEFIGDEDINVEELYNTIDTIVDESITVAIEEHEKDRDPDVGDVQPENIVEEMNIPLLEQLKTLDYKDLKEIVEKYADNKHLANRPAATNAAEKVKEPLLKPESEKVVKPKTEKKKRTVRVDLEVPSTENNATPAANSEAAPVEEKPVAENKEEKKPEKPKFDLY